MCTEAERAGAGAVAPNPGPVLPSPTSTLGSQGSQSRLPDTTATPFDYVANRTIQQILAARSRGERYLAQRAAASLAGFDLGPLAFSNEQMKDGVHALTRCMPCGGFNVSISHYDKPTATAGNRLEISCTSSSCPWKLKYEWTNPSSPDENMGWRLYSCHLQHSDHELFKSTAASMVSASGRNIPDDFVETGELLAASGLSAKRPVFRSVCGDCGLVQTRASGGAEVQEFSSVHARGGSFPRI